MKYLIALTSLFTFSLGLVTTARAEITPPSGSFNCTGSLANTNLNQNVPGNIKFIHLHATVTPHATLIDLNVTMNLGDEKSASSVSETFVAEDWSATFYHYAGMKLLANHGFYYLNYDYPFEPDKGVGFFRAQFVYAIGELASPGSIRARFEDIVCIPE